jgi:hypothetical protein
MGLLVVDEVAGRGSGNILQGSMVIQFCTFND